MDIIFNKKTLLSFLFSLFAIFIVILSFADESEMKRIENIKPFNTLAKVDKIIVETIEIGDSKKESWSFEDQNEIKFVISELDASVETEGMFQACEYKIIFEESRKTILNIDLHLDIDYPGASFFRFRTEKMTYHYAISKALFEFFVKHRVLHS